MPKPHPRPIRPQHLWGRWGTRLSVSLKTPQGIAWQAGLKGAAVTFQWAGDPVSALNCLSSFLVSPLPPPFSPFQSIRLILKVKKQKKETPPSPTPCWTCVSSETIPRPKLLLISTSLDAVISEYGRQSFVKVNNMTFHTQHCGPGKPNSSQLLCLQRNLFSTTLLFSLHLGIQC